MNNDVTASQTSAVSDEISIIDLWNIILRRKKTVIATFLIVFATGIAVTIFMPPLYESRAVVLIGIVSNQLIEDPNELVQRLIEEYKVDDSSEAIIEPPYVESVKVDNKRASNVLELTVRDTTAEGAKTYLEIVVNKLSKEHKALFDKAMELERQRLDSMAKQISELDAQIRLVNDLSIPLKKSDPNQAAVLAIESGKYLSMKPGLEKNLVDLDIQLSELKSKPTRYLREPTLPRKAKRPRPMLYIAVAIVLGFFMAIFAAFLHELTVQAREKFSQS